jgi:hypothetical protein
MLHSAFLRRVVAVVGIGAAGVSPAIPILALALFGASPVIDVNAAPVGIGAGWLADVPAIDPEDVEDGTGGIGDPDWPPIDDEEDVPPEDVEDNTGGIGGDLP